MATNARHMVGIRPVDVFDVLRNGESYGDWVVGTRRVREASANWPGPGAALHYEVGYSALRKGDRTLSVAYQPDELLELEVQAWPFGSIRVVITADAVADGTKVVIEEGPKEGVLTAVPSPLVDAAIGLRNVETLRRLEKHAQRVRGTS